MTFPSRDYYVREELRFGPPYDLEVYGLEEAQERELEGEERSDMLDRLEDISDELDLAKKSRAGLASGVI